MGFRMLYHIREGSSGTFLLCNLNLILFLFRKWMVGLAFSMNFVSLLKQNIYSSSALPYDTLMIVAYSDLLDH